MQSVLSRIWTRVAVSNSYDDNHYTTGTSSFITAKIYNVLLLNHSELEIEKIFKYNWRKTFQTEL